MGAPEIFSSSFFTLVYWETQNCRPLASKRFWGCARKMTGILSLMATRKFWLMGRSVSQMVGVMMPSS